jgi:predicted O-methyltransferase YrrM
VDVGTNLGHSATWLLLGVERNQKGRIWTFDIQDWRSGMGYGGLFFWQRYGLPDRPTFVQKAVWDAEELPAEIDFVFEDASHDEEPSKRQLEVLTPRMRPGGTMAFHDIFLCRHEGEILLKWFGDRKGEWDYKEIQMGRGLGVATRK